MENCDEYVVSVDSLGRHVGAQLNDATPPVAPDDPLAAQLSIPRADVEGLIAALEQLHQRLPSRSLRGAIMRVRRWLTPSS